MICHTQFGRAAGVRTVCNRGGIGCPISHVDGHLDYVTMAKGYALPIEDNSERGYQLMWEGEDPMQHPSIVRELPARAEERYSERRINPDNPVALLLRWNTAWSKASVTIEDPEADALPEVFLSKAELYDLAAAALSYARDLP